MSVAFRRESDDEHREPIFELPIPPGANLVTERGQALIEERIAALEALLPVADEDAAKPIRRDLRYWHTRRTTAVPTSAPLDGTVGFGSTVELRLNGAARTVALVGSDEADPDRGLIPFTAPLAQALLGAEVGDALPFGGQEEAIEVISVR